MECLNVYPELHSALNFNLYVPYAHQISSSLLVLISADVYKGSFYANPIVDVPTTDEALIERSDRKSYL